MTIERLECTVCGENYNYDDKDSPKWASIFCGTPCRDQAGYKMEENDGYDDVEEYDDEAEDFED